MQLKSIGKTLAVGLVAMTLIVSSTLAEKGTVTASSLRLRTEASTDSKVIRTIPHGASVEILSSTHNWYKVSYAGSTGYVYKTYVSVSKGSGSSSSSSSSSSASSSNGLYTNLKSDLSVGSSGDVVRAVQRRLSELGYYSSSVDGNYGTVTANAVKAFQKNNGLDATGLTGNRTLSKLRSSSAVKANGKQENASTDTKPSNTLKYGDQGEQVRKLQERLTALGYYNTTIDSDYGYCVQTAVKAFQKKNGLSETGTVDATTLSKINSSSAIKADGSKTDGSSTSSSKPSNALAYGDQGEQVRKAQERLAALGFYTNSIDGDYGYCMQTAVKEFQKKNGLSVSGILDSATLSKLNSSSAIKADASSSDDRLTIGSTGEKVREVQKRLKELGYYESSTDGSFGEVTAEAVKAFQKRNGLTQDGIVGPNTLSKLNSSSAITAEGKEVGNSDVLTIGATGDQVTQVQRYLKELGYYSSSLDGQYGSVTAAAVKVFQQRNGLKETGETDSKTLERLKSKDAVSADGFCVEVPSISGELTTGASGHVVEQIQRRLKELGYYNTTIDGQYGAQTSKAVEAFQAGNKLTATGVVNNQTIKAMNSSDAVDAEHAKNVTKRLDWFEDGKNMFRSGRKLEIKDVRTGLTFRAQVLYGSNHLDAEPLTKADTEILRQANGGKFDWHRRPVLVKYNGSVYAASIYSEPHGDANIDDNGFDGQFCLHFYGSKTHGSDRVDEDHQRCESEALEASW